MNIKNIGLAVIATIIMAAQAQVLGPVSWAAYLFFVLWALLAAGVGYAFWKLPGHLFRRRPELGLQQTVQLDRDELSFRTEKGGEVFCWDELTKTIEDDRFVLFYFGPRLPHVIPKRVFGQGGAASEETFRRQLQSQVE